MKKKKIDKILEKYDGIIITGQRCCGKTKAGIKVLRHLAEKYPLSRGLIVTPTLHDAHYLSQRLVNEVGAEYQPTQTMVKFGEVNNYLISAEDSSSLRGHQAGIVWMEEVNHPTQQTIEQIILTLRLKPEKIIITSSEPEKLLSSTWLSKKNFYTYYLNQDVDRAWELNQRMKGFAAAA